MCGWRINKGKTTATIEKGASEQGKKEGKSRGLKKQSKTVGTGEGEGARREKGKAKETREHREKEWMCVECRHSS